MEKEISLNALSNYLKEFHKFFHSAVSTAAREENLSLTQYRFLRLLEGKKEIALKEIKKSLEINQSSASELAERMLKAGFIEKSENKNDKRYTLYKPTAKVKIKLANMNKKFEKISNKIFNSLSEDDKRKLIKNFEEIMKILNKIKLTEEK